MPRKQFTLIAFGLLLVGLTIGNVIRGQRRTYWGTTAERRSSPTIFWLTIAIDGAISIAFLAYAIVADH